MNLYTRSLLQQLKGRRLNGAGELEALIAHWDALEELVIRVFKGKSASAGDQEEHRRLRNWLQKNYPRWQARLQPFWQQARVAGAPPREDPFVYLLAIPQAGDFVKNWAAMQTLPAARETLNHFLVSLIQKP